MADDKVDEESAQTGGEDENEAPKKSFGILAARFLQKGKSSPGSITGEFEALVPPDQTPTPDPKVRNLNPVDDEYEEIREGSIHGMEVPLTESLYADIGLDDMSGFDEPEQSFDRSEESSAPADVIYDIDAGEQPVISFGSGVADEHAHDIELAGGEADFGGYEESAQLDSSYTEPVQNEEEAVSQAEAVQYEEEAVAQTEPVQYEEESVAQTEPVQYEEEESVAQTEPVQYEEESVAQTEAVQYEEEAVSQTEPVQYEEEAVSEAEPVQYEEASHDESAFHESSDQDLAAADNTYHAEQEASHSVTAETNEAENSAPSDNYAPTPAYDLSELDSIGISKETTFDKNVLDQIGSGDANNKVSAESETPPAVPEKKGLLGKFAGKKESTQKPLFGGGAKLESSEPATEKPYDPAALDSIGTKGFDKSALDSIGTKDFDKGALDAIGTKGFDKGALDSIGEAAPATPEGKDKAPKGGGLLGGKFGQKAKASGGDKLKVGGINPPSVDPNFDQKETGRFMVNQSELDALGSSQSLTPEPAQDFSSAASALPPEMDLSASSAVSEEAPVDESAYEHTPVIGADEVGRLITDADNAYRLRQFRAAEPIFANVLDKLDKTGDDSDPLLPYCLDKMSDNLYQLKKYNEALQYLRRLLVLHTKISSEDRDMISTLYKIAQCCEALSLTSEADSMYKRAFRLGQQSLVPGDPLLAKVLEGYGTMLMRSEGAEPPAGSSEKSEEAPTKTPRSAEVQSALSAEEIAMLNSLGASSERSSAEPSPIILSGGPTGASEQSSGKSRSPLKQSDERADKVRATTGPVGGSTAGGVWVRLGIFLSVIVGLVLVTLNIKTDYTSHHVDHSKDFVKRVYKSADGGATFTISSEDEAAKDNFGKHFVYEYRDWNGTPSDDIEVISGQVNGDNFIYEIPQGIKDGSGAIFFEPHASELTVTAKMHELGNKAQAYFKSKGKYPDGKDLAALAKSVDYKNPFTQTADSISAAGIAWPPSLDATQLLMKSSFDTGMENGDLWEGEAAPKPGLISAASASQKQPDASVFYIHGRDRDGKLITRADGKVYVLIYKNGIDVTPGAADFKNEKPGPGPAPMRLSKKDGSITAITIILSYLPVVFFLILALVFLAMLNKGSGRIGRFSVPTFGVMWSPVMVLLTGLAKFVPAPYSMICVGLAAVVFVGGLGWLAFNILKNKPKKS
ncbi:MAG: hypothetical protein JST44_01720 [Cyanobacteria bacterium SZAS LIN-5]|nr:hypothetical protein [Cyanobacteria bacterium SZAS LIN-5]